MDVAQAWLDLLPGGQVFAAECITYRTPRKYCPAQWTHPLGDRLATAVPGFAGARFSALAARTTEVTR